jgi:hypothetical protein
MRTSTAGWGETGLQFVNPARRPSATVAETVGWQGVRLWSRNGRDWCAEFLAIAAVVRSLPFKRLMLDGEAVAHCPEGLPDFYGLMGSDGQAAACFYAFDLLWLGAQDVRGLSRGPDGKARDLAQPFGRCRAEAARSALVGPRQPPQARDCRPTRCGIGAPAHAGRGPGPAARGARQSPPLARQADRRTVHEHGRDRPPRALQRTRGAHHTQPRFPRPRRRQSSRRGSAAVRIEHVKLLGAAHPVGGTATPRKLMLLLLYVRTRGRRFDSDLVRMPGLSDRA